MMRVISLIVVAAISHGQPDALTIGIEQFHHFLALSRAALGRCDAAVPELTTQFEKNSDRELRRLAGLAVVQCQLAQNQFGAAAEMAARLQSLFPSDADVLYQLARVHRMAWNDAVFQMFQKTPSSFRVNQLSAEILEIDGKYSEAAAEYRKAIAKTPSSLNLHFRLGRAVLLQSHEPAALSEARKEFEAELALNPSDAAAEFQVGQTLMAEQKNGDAAKRFDRALELKPDFAEAAIALAKIRLQEKKTSEAIRLLEHAVQLQPKNESARYSLMLAYRNDGRADEAAKQKSELEKLQKPQDGEFSDFLKRLGDKPKQP
jgi:tetratricopeptide (TPR) repeat protein